MPGNASLVPLPTPLSTACPSVSSNAIMHSAVGAAVRSESMSLFTQTLSELMFKTTFAMVGSLSGFGTVLRIVSWTNKFAVTTTLRLTTQLATASSIHISSIGSSLAVLIRYEFTEQIVLLQKTISQLWVATRYRAKMVLGSPSRSPLGWFWTPRGNETFFTWIYSASENETIQTIKTLPRIAHNETYVANATVVNCVLMFCQDALFNAVESNRQVTKTWETCDEQ